MFQHAVMMALGYFVFMQKTVPYQEISRELSWNHPSNGIVGGLPKSQFTGKAGETLTISGVLMPEITGGTLSLTALELMAEQGKPYPLISGSTFLVLGWFVIESINMTNSVLFGDGTPRRIDFSMTLKRTDDAMLANLVDDVMSLF